MIEVTNLTKRYGSVTAVDGLSFAVPAGSVTGFVGPNGSGKSTTMRCLVGLTTPTSGTATVFGRNYAELGNPAVRVGTLLDANAFHKGRSGRNTLRLATTVMGIAPTRIEQVLGLVGLSRKEADRLVGQYSLGMRQRLGIAQALLGNPEILILDEPANGLDPQGISWMRGLLSRFADAGGAVLLSSHLLAEMERIADRVVMIGHGRLIASGSVAELTRDGRTLEDHFLAATADTARTTEGPLA